MKSHHHTSAFDSTSLSSCMHDQGAPEDIDVPQLYFKVMLIIIVFALPLLAGSSAKWTPVGSFMVLALLLSPWKMRHLQGPQRPSEPLSSFD
mmetsp:Transcript_36687/g.76622  ORF Transcript_36687/g.76622 Transcript_36687/m.76622 type:complete len:92 (-) Transcript_36687:239-514(-)